MGTEGTTKPREKLNLEIDAEERGLETQDELKTEAHRWKNALIGSVIGAFPRLQGMENFAHKRWRNYGLISVHMVKANIFLFNS